MAAIILKNGSDMKNPRAIAMLVMSLLIGVGGDSLAAGWIVQQGQAALEQGRGRGDRHRLGSRLKPQLLKTVDWPSGSIPSGAVSDAQSLQDRVVKTAFCVGSRF
jgi:pilus assembly protein CpaB